MGREDELRKDILKLCENKYNIESKNIEIKIIIKNGIPDPSEFASKGALLELMGKVGEYFVYGVRKGYRIIEILLTFYALFNIAKVHYPKQYNFIAKYGKELIEGHSESVSEKNKKEDRFLAVRPEWFDDPKLYQQDYSNYTNGDYSTLTQPNVAFIPASGTVDTITDTVISTNGSDDIHKITFV